LAVFNTIFADQATTENQAAKGKPSGFFVVASYEMPRMMLHRSNSRR
jgi:hypothetical protein